MFDFLLLRERDRRLTRQALADMRSQPICKTPRRSQRRVQQDDRCVIALGIEKRVRRKATRAAVMPVVARLLIKQPRQRDLCPGHRIRAQNMLLLERRAQRC